MRKQVWRYGVQVHGVKNRCRKSDWHYTDKNELGEVETVDQKEAIDRAKQWIAKNMKSVTPDYARATAKLWEIDGEIETWSPFNKEHNLSWPVSLEG